MLVRSTFPVSFRFRRAVVSTMMNSPIQNSVKNPRKSWCCDCESKCDTRLSYVTVGKIRFRRACRAWLIETSDGGASSGSGVAVPLYTRECNSSIPSVRRRAGGGNPPRQRRGVAFGPLQFRTEEPVVTATYLTLLLLPLTQPRIAGSSVYRCRSSCYHLGCHCSCCCE